MWLEETMWQFLSDVFDVVYYNTGQDRFDPEIIMLVWSASRCAFKALEYIAWSLSALKAANSSIPRLSYKDPPHTHTHTHTHQLPLCCDSPMGNLISIECWGHKC